MESTRRPFDRSLSKEPGAKKLRLAEDQAAAGRRPVYAQRPVSSVSGARVQRDRDSGGSDSVRRSAQPQQSHLPHWELVNQYKNALSELTFNSKPIITNLTIIAGENLHAAKAIAATVCAHILEVPKEQKLPSLYLLDSIVKNIGEDYIDYFALELPEVFCKAYRQVDPSTRQGMRHLFGTWKAVFEPEPLHIIQKELGFSNVANGTSSGVTTLRPDAQTQRPSGQAHSIHVNPKYLEARQQLPTSARGSASEIGDALVSSHVEVGAPGRSSSNKIHQRNQGIRFSSIGDEKLPRVPYLDSEYGSNSSVRSGMGAGRLNDKFKDRELDGTWYGSISEMGIEKLPSDRNSFGSKHRVGSYNEDPFIKNLNVASWKYSQEEEYAWDDLKAKTVRRETVKRADSLFTNSWSPADYEKEDLDSYQPRLQMLNERESNIDAEAVAGFLPSKTVKELSGTRVPFKSAMDYSDGYLSSRDSSSKMARTQFQPQHRPSPNGQSLSVPIGEQSRPKDYGTAQRQINATAPSLLQSAKQKRPPSPSLSVRNFSQPTNKSEDRNRTSYGPPSDPRKSHSRQSAGSADQFLQSREVHQTKRAKSVSQPKKHAPPISTKIIKVEDSGDARNLISSQVSRSGGLSSFGNSSPDHSNPLAVDSPGRSINSSFLIPGVRIGGASPVSSSSGFQEVTLGQSPEEDEPAPSSSHGASSLHGVRVGDVPGSISPSSNPVSSLLSSLVAKGLISGSKSELPFSSSIQKPAEVSTSASLADSSMQITRVEAPLSVANEPPSLNLPDKASDALPQSTTEVKNFIGFEFKPEVIRNLHPDVLADLFSHLSHKCAICGVRLNVEDSVAKHMEWHALREQSSSNGNSRSWYKSLLDWFSVESALDLVEEPDTEPESTPQHMVPADESQMACIICGDLFEDYYCPERNEWMFKGAIYLPIQDSSEPSGSTVEGPVVHVGCKSEDFIQNLRILSDAKPEKGE